MRLGTNLCSARNRCLERIAHLDLDAKPRWGRLSAHQMVSHLNHAFLVAMGDKFASSATSLLARTVVKFVGWYLPLPWRHGVPTRPELEQGRGGAPPADWERDQAVLRAFIIEFPARRRFGTHPMWGALSGSDWQVWAYRPLDHHLRQFGV